MATGSPVMTLKTPGSTPVSWCQPGQRQRRQRRLFGGLDDHRAAGGDGGATLRVIIASGKFHGVIAAQTPIGCLIVIRRLSANHRWNGRRRRLASSANHQ